MRKTTKGRRRVEQNEFCIKCNKLKHTEEIERLTARVAELEWELEMARGLHEDHYEAVNNALGW
jgi:hypothetical protein